MIFVYDTVLTGKPEVFRRYGITYHLEKRFRMGNRTFYSYIAPGAEKILVIPGFAQQYREAEAKCRKYGTGKSLEDYQRLIRRDINRFIVTEEVPNDDSRTGVMHNIYAVYKDIQVTFEYMNDILGIAPEFEIVEDNIFGNGIVVAMNINMEDA